MQKLPLNGTVNLNTCNFSSISLCQSQLCWWKTVSQLSHKSLISLWSPIALNRLLLEFVHRSKTNIKRVSIVATYFCEMIPPLFVIICQLSFWYDEWTFYLSLYDNAEMQGVPWKEFTVFWCELITFIFIFMKHSCIRDRSKLSCASDYYRHKYFYWKIWTDFYCI